MGRGAGGRPARRLFIASGVLPGFEVPLFSRSRSERAVSCGDWHPIYCASKRVLFGYVLERFDADGVMRGPASERRGASVSREDAARTASAVLADPAGSTHDVTGPEVLSLAEVARQSYTLPDKLFTAQKRSGTIVSRVLKCLCGDSAMMLAIDSVRS